MRITAIETIPLEAPLPRTFRGSHYAMSSRATLVTRVYTDEGLVGESYNGDEPGSQLEIARIVAEEITPRLQWHDPRQVERCWQDMLPVTFDILRDRRLPVMAMAAVDSCLWDIVGKAAGLPLAAVWGGFRDRLPIVAIGGYYGQSPAELGREAERCLELGLAGCKLKVGGAAPAEDAERARAMREAGGEGFVLLADANQGYTVDEAVRFCRLADDVDLRWFEEPVRWDGDRTGLRDVRVRTGVPVAAGQSELGRAGILDLLAAGSIDVCNFDASWGGGPTEWRRVAGLTAAYGVALGHHEEPQLAAQLLASVPHGTYLECFLPERDPVFWQLLANRGEIADGHYQLPDAPGLGLELDHAFVERHRLDAGRAGPRPHRLPDTT